jgi:tetratricopeptide (TPR) repeat protein
MLASANFHAAIAEDGPAALEHWTKAGAAYGALLADRPDDHKRQRNVALVEKYLATYYLDTSELPRALEHQRRALALDEKRLTADPDTRLTKFDVAIDLSNAALIAYTMGNVRESADYYERSLALRVELAESDPQNDLARSRVAYAQKQLALVYRELGNLPRAYELTQAALAIHESRRSRGDLAWRADYALTLQAHGLIEEDRGRRTDACAAFARAWTILEALTDADLGAVVDTTKNLRQQVGERAAACGVAVRPSPRPS